MLAIVHVESISHVEDILPEIPTCDVLPHATHTKFLSLLSHIFFSLCLVLDIWKTIQCDDEF